MKHVTFLIAEFLETHQTIWWGTLHARSVASRDAAELADFNIIAHGTASKVCDAVVVVVTCFMSNSRRANGVSLCARSTELLNGLQVSQFANFATFANFAFREIRETCKSAKFVFSEILKILHFSESANFHEFRGVSRFPSEFDIWRPQTCIFLHFAKHALS